MIELRPEPSAPRDLAARLGAILGEATGTRWTIALSHAPGEPTLAEQDDTAGRAQLAQAAEHPLVRAILDAFPGAKLGPAEDLPPPAAAGEPDVPRDVPGDVPEDMPEFAPPDAELADAEFADTVDLEETEP